MRTLGHQGVLAGAQAASAGGWDSAVLRTNGSGAAWTIDSNPRVVVLTTPVSGGGFIAGKNAKNDKRYCELVWTGTLEGQHTVGFVNHDVTVPGGAGRLGVEPNEFGIRLDGVALNEGSVPGTYTTWATGDVMMLAADPATGKGWVGKNGTWMNSGDPAAGTGNIFTTLDSVGVRYGCGADNAGTATTTCTSRLNAGDFTYSPPSGFSGWDD